MGCKLLIHDNYELHPAIAYLVVVQIASPQCVLKARYLRWLCLCVVHIGMPELALDHSPRFAVASELFVMHSGTTLTGYPRS